MPELKNTFQGGKMEKDKDERIVPNGQYREALNVSVSTSEDSDVGAAQNILGNICVTQAAKGRTQTNTTITGLVGSQYEDENFHITEIVDPQSDMMYRFLHTASASEGVWMDRVIEYDTTKSLDASWQDKEHSVSVDIFKVQATLSSHVDVCTSSNKAYITINKNTNQLRWGMRVEFGSEDPITFIEDIDYVTNKIYLSGNTSPSISNGSLVTFYGDRNLNFDPARTITGLNIIDGMLFWTDNYSEPKKIDIKRSKMGSNTSLWSTTTGLIGRYSGLPIPKIDDFNQHTVLVVAENATYDCMTNDLIGEGCPGDKGSRSGGYNQDTIIDTSVPIVIEEEEESFYDQQEQVGFDLGSFQNASSNQQEEVADGFNSGS